MNYYSYCVKTLHYERSRVRFPLASVSREESTRWLAGAEAPPPIFFLFFYVITLLKKENRKRRW